MKYANFELIRPLYSTRKKVSSASLKIGDRFIFEGHESLMFKTNAEPNDGKYLCCDEFGRTEWISGNIQVIRINGVAATLAKCSITIKENFLLRTELEIGEKSKMISDFDPAKHLENLRKNYT